MAQNKSRIVRHRRVRAKILGSAVRPRLNVFRSLKNFYVQLIDDAAGKTLAAASSKEIKAKGKKTDVAGMVGKLAAEKAIKLGITEAVFDRGGYKYHGRIKQAAEAAREAGLKF
ncbi:MAG: 50S ribosomal protein L18 [Acidobacteriaceae bacterium]